MGLLAAVSYDPATAVTKSCAALQALTAMDTVNLRLSFTPTKNKVWVYLGGTLHGAATYPQILLGILEGAVVKFRRAPMLGGGNLAATTLCSAESSGTVPVTPNVPVVWDAAWAVETLVAATGVKYGGPNNAVTNDAFGAFVFMVWE